MIRKYNYKRKKEITRKMFSINLENNEEYYYLKIDHLDLEGLDHDPDFEIFLKVWTSQSPKKYFYLGTFSKPETNLIPEESILPFIRKGITKKVEGELFIVDPRDTYIKRSTSSKFTVHNFDVLVNPGSLLPVKYDDLNQIPWNIEYGMGEEMPILNINNKLKEYEFIEFLSGNGSLLRSMVIYPAFKEVLRKIIIENESSTPENCSDEWCAGWLRFVLKIHSISIPEFDNNNFMEIEEWIESAAQNLCEKGGLLKDIQDEILNLG